MSLMPSKARLGGESIKRQNMITQVTAMFVPDDYISDKKLSGEFLLGYHCQREDLKPKKPQADGKEINDSSENS